MNSPTYLKPLRIEIRNATVKVGEIYRQLGHIRVQGWIEAPTKPEGFAADLALGEHLGISSIGGYCDERDESKAVSFPFCFDLQRGYINTRSIFREETSDEFLSRVQLTLSRARRHFSKLPSTAT